MDMPEWLAEGRNIGANPAKIARMIVWSLESGGIEGMEDTSEAMKRQKLLIQEPRHDAKSHTEVTGKEKPHKETQDGVGTAEGLIKIITEESVLACLDSGRPLGPGKDTLAYGIGVTLFQREKNRQKASKNCFSVDHRRARQGHDDQKEGNLITVTGLYLWVHSLEGPLHEIIIWAVCTDLQSYHCPQRTNTRVTWDVTVLEDHYNRAGCPLKTENRNALIKQLGHDQGKGNNIMLDKQSYRRREHLEEEKGQQNTENTETPRTQSRQCLGNITATLTADPLCRTDSLLESEQPCGNTKEGETGTVKIRFTLKERNQCQPMIYGWHNESIIGN
jgi:hypothetical protein